MLGDGDVNLTGGSCQFLRPGAVNLNPATIVYTGSVGQNALPAGRATMDYNGIRQRRHEGGHRAEPSKRKGLTPQPNRR